MGIPGIYKELGPGERISLAKLSVEHLEKTGRRFRLAIDISIWQFQIQSGEGGRNPALRTLYYRLLKLLSLGICPLFVFDGPYKPRLKRNVKSSMNIPYLDNFLTKQLLRKFEFPFRDAPGEAEAECALLQREGVVDAVLSEDVDTLMFGCTTSLRNWTPEGSRGGKSPTHVTIYTAEANARNAGLDRNGMILVALMSGGDYNTGGIHGCGPKIACEAARAGFGRDLGRLAQNDRNGWNRWRISLQHELHTNESKFFGQKNKSINLPVDFPDQTILSYYLRPVVSSPEDIVHLRGTLKWDTDIQTSQLRAFVAEAFNWTHLMGAKHFVSTFAPALLIQKLLRRQQLHNFDDHDDLEAKASTEARLIANVHGSRTHWNTDGCVELRVSYTPSTIVGLDLNLESDFYQELDKCPTLSDNEAGNSDSEEKNHLTSPSKQNISSKFEPDQLNRIWVLETFVKLGTPLLVENWEEEMRNPKKFAARKAQKRALHSKCQIEPLKGAMDRFVKTTKSISERERSAAQEIVQHPSAFHYAKNPDSAAAAAAASTSVIEIEQEDGKRLKGNRSRLQNPVVMCIEGYNATVHPKATSTTNPWTLSERSSNTYALNSSRQDSQPRIYGPNESESFEFQNKRPAISTETTPIRQRRGCMKVHTKNIPQATSDLRVLNQVDLRSDESIRKMNNVALRPPRQLDSARPLSRKGKTFAKAGDGDISRLPPRQSGALHEKVLLDHVDSDIDETTELYKTSTGFKKMTELPQSLNQAQEGTCESPTSSNSSLPSPSRLLCLREHSKLEFSTAPTRRDDESTKLSHMLKTSHREHTLVSLRESLEGAWKHLSPGQAYSSARNVFRDVDVLDLTNWT